MSKEFGNTAKYYSLLPDDLNDGIYAIDEIESFLEIKEDTVSELFSMFMNAEDDKLQMYQVENSPSTNDGMSINKVTDPVMDMRKENSERGQAYSTIQFLFYKEGINSAMSFYENAFKKKSPTHRLRKEFLKKEEFGTLLQKEEHNTVKDSEMKLLLRIFGRDLRKEILLDLKQKGIKSTNDLIDNMKNNNTHLVDINYFNKLGVEYVGNRKGKRAMTLLGNVLRPEEKINEETEEETSA